MKLQDILFLGAIALGAYLLFKPRPTGVKAVETKRAENVTFTTVKKYITPETFEKVEDIFAKVKKIF